MPEGCADKHFPARSGHSGRGSRSPGRCCPSAWPRPTGPPPSRTAWRWPRSRRSGPARFLLYVCDPDVSAAVFGELFGHAARARGAAGVVADGPIRDAAALAEAAWPVFASAFSPLDTNGRAEVVAIGETLRCGDVEVARGDLIVGDEDGVVLCPAACADDVRAAVRRKLDGESGARADLEQGVPLTVVWERWGVL